MFNPHKLMSNSLSAIRQLSVASKLIKKTQLGLFSVPISAGTTIYYNTPQNSQPSPNSIESLDQDHKIIGDF